MYKILETDGKRGAWFICVLLIISMELRKMAPNKCSINTCKNNQLKLRIVKLETVYSIHILCPQCLAHKKHSVHMWRGKMPWRNALDGFSARKRVLSALSLGTQTANLEFYIPHDNERQQRYTEHEKFLPRQIIILHSPSTKIEILFWVIFKTTFQYQQNVFHQIKKGHSQRSTGDRSGLLFIFSFFLLSWWLWFFLTHNNKGQKMPEDNTRNQGTVTLLFFFFKRNLKSHCLDHYSSIKRTKLLIHKRTWMNLHRITLS